jgi:hypothetical protein
MTKASYGRRQRPAQDNDGIEFFCHILVICISTKNIRDDELRDIWDAAMLSTSSVPQSRGGSPITRVGDSMDGGDLRPKSPESRPLNRTDALSDLNIFMTYETYTTIPWIL